MEELARHAIGSLLPDLPGTGESEVELTEIGKHDWTDALRRLHSTVSASCNHIVALRGGALLDGFDSARPCRRWHLEPTTGQRLLRNIDRAASMSTAAAGGWPMSGALRGELMGAVPVTRGEVRTARLAGAAAPADVRLNGSPLWRRAEPGEDITLLAEVAADIVGWVEK